MKNCPIELLLNELNSSPKRIKLLRAVPTNKFFSIENWPSIKAIIPENLIIWLHRLPLKSGNLQVKYDTSFKLPLGKLHYLYSDILPVGYIVEMPKSAHLEITDTYISAKLNKSVAPKITGVEQVAKAEHILNNPHISIYTHGNGVLIASLSSSLINHIS